MGALTRDERRLARQLAASPTPGASVRVRGVWQWDVASNFVRLSLGLLLGLVIWQIVAMVFNAGASSLGFPYPLQTFQQLGSYLSGQESLYGFSVYKHILASVKRLLIAFGLASAVGIVLSSVLGYFEGIYQIGMVPVALYQMIPGLAWLPVALLLFGLGDESAVFIIFAVSSMVITIGVSSGIRMVPPVMVNAAKMTGASGPSIFVHVLVPHAAASVVNALRLGMASAWRVLIAAEMVVGTGLGVGYAIGLTRDLLNYLGSFACITLICLIGLFFDRVVLASAERAIRQRLGMEAG